MIRHFVALLVFLVAALSFPFSVQAVTNYVFSGVITDTQIDYSLGPMSETALFPGDNWTGHISYSNDPEYVTAYDNGIFTIDLPFYLKVDNITFKTSSYSLLYSESSFSFWIHDNAFINAKHLQTNEGLSLSFSEPVVPFDVTPYHLPDALDFLSATNASLDFEIISPDLNDLYYVRVNASVDKAQPVPEPTSLLFLSLGLLCAALLRPWLQRKAVNRA